MRNNITHMNDKSGPKLILYQNLEVVEDEPDIAGQRHRWLAEKSGRS